MQKYKQLIIAFLSCQSYDGLLLYEDILICLKEDKERKNEKYCYSKYDGILGKETFLNRKEVIEYFQRISYDQIMFFLEIIGTLKANINEQMINKEIYRTNLIEQAEQLKENISLYLKDVLYGRLGLDPKLKGTQICYEIIMDLILNNQIEFNDSLNEYLREVYKMDTSKCSTVHSNIRNALGSCNLIESYNWADVEDIFPNLRGMPSTMEFLFQISVYVKNKFKVRENEHLLMFV